MKSLLAGFLFLVSCFPALAAPPDAVVRIASHGASGTVIHTEPNRTLILSCAHAFQGKDRQRPIQLDVPHATPGSPKRARIILLAIDYEADLSLIELRDGPLPYSTPVAPAGWEPRHCLSVGYDEMRLPATQRSATILLTRGGVTFTREQPWHGRSGGALLDPQAGYLIGVVQGYEVGGQGRGLYVSHAAILAFLQRSQAPPRPPSTPPPVRPRQSCPT